MGKFADVGTTEKFDKNWDIIKEVLFFGKFCDLYKAVFAIVFHVICSILTFICCADILFWLYI